MGVVLHLSALALRQLAGAAGWAVGLDGAEAAVDLLAAHFTDHSQRLIKALRSANERAWKALELALAGESFWRRCRSACARAEDRAFRDQVRAFLDAAPLPGPAGDAAFRADCLRELRAARAAGLLSSGGLDLQRLAHRAGAFACFADPQAVLDAGRRALDDVAGELFRAGHARLAQLLGMAPTGGEPLLAAAVGYFFRRAVEADAELFRGLAWAKLEAAEEAQAAGFAALAAALERDAGRLEDLLNGVREAVAATHGAVLDLQDEQRRQGGVLGGLHEQVGELLRFLDLLRRDLRPGDGRSVSDDGERRRVRDLAARFRALPAEKRRDWPALLNALGKLELTAGDPDAAQSAFAEVAAAVADPAARAEAHFNAYHAALARRDWPPALGQLKASVRLDARRFAPFPAGKYHPLRILGAGGFGAAFLCRHKALDADVVVKTLPEEGLGRGVDDVLAEARLLFRLAHPCIIQLLDCGYTLPAGRSRPYLVMSGFEGETVAERVGRRGPLGARDGLAVARLMAEGLAAAHARGVLHRDVKPANLLVRKETDGWRLKLIDFGLALRTGPVTGGSRATAAGRLLAVGGVAGSTDYAAPEQVGRAPGVPAGPYSDVYRWARTCRHALFGTARPLPRHWKAVPPGRAAALERCLEEDPRGRPADFAEVLDRLDALAGVRAAPAARMSDGAADAARTALPAAGGAPGRRPALPQRGEGAARAAGRAGRLRASDPPKSPALMAVLSLLLAGLGQMVLGQLAKGVVVLLATVALGVLTAGVAAPVLWAVGACDAYAIAKKLKQGRAVGRWEFF
jgi:hypothetical protein